MNVNLIIQMLRNLEADNIFSTKEFYKDIVSLIDTDEKKYIKNFSTHMKISNLNEYNKFEELFPEKKDKIKLKNNRLFRYEYRMSNKNVKCIFVVEESDGRKILLCAFNEDASKKKGNDNYDFNIKRAVNIYNKLDL